MLLQINWHCIYIMSFHCRRRVRMVVRFTISMKLVLNATNVVSSNPAQAMGTR